MQVCNRVGSSMRRRSRLRDLFVAMVVGLSLALVGILFVALVPIVPHPFSDEFALLSRETLTLPVGSWVTGSWKAQPGDTLTFVVAPPGGSPAYQNTGTSATFAFLATRATYDFFVSSVVSNHDAMLDRVFLNGTFMAPLLWS